MLRQETEYNFPLIRLMKDLQQINLKKFVQVNERVEEVSKQLAGWQKSLQR